MYKQKKSPPYRLAIDEARVYTKRQPIGTVIELQRHFLSQLLFPGPSHIHHKPGDGPTSGLHPIFLSVSFLTQGLVGWDGASKTHSSLQSLHSKVLNGQPFINI